MITLCDNYKIFWILNRNFLSQLFTQYHLFHTWFLSPWPWSCFPVLGFRTSRGIYSVCLLLNFTNRKTILSLYSEFMVIVFVCSLINTSDRVTSLSQTSVLDRRDTVFWCVRGHPVLSFIVNRLFYNLSGHFSQSRPWGKTNQWKKLHAK